MFSFMFFFFPFFFFFLFSALLLSVVFGLISIPSEEGVRRAKAFC